MALTSKCSLGSHSRGQECTSTLHGAIDKDLEVHQMFMARLQQVCPMRHDIYSKITSNVTSEPQGQRLYNCT